jgi:hypothetical protein
VTAWDESITTLGRRDRVPAAQANAVLLESARAEWEGTPVVPRTSMHDLLFTNVGDAYPWAVSVRVSWSDGVFEFSLVRGGLLVTADRCRAENSIAVLGAFLCQLLADVATE